MLQKQQWKRKDSHPSFLSWNFLDYRSPKCCRQAAADSWPRPLWSSSPHSGPSAQGCCDPQECQTLHAVLPGPGPAVLSTGGPDMLWLRPLPSGRHPESSGHSHPGAPGCTGFLSRGSPARLHPSHPGPAQSRAERVGRAHSSGLHACGFRGTMWTGTLSCLCSTSPPGLEAAQLGLHPRPEPPNPDPAGQQPHTSRRDG